ncbi:MAG: hypothetical protein JO257_04335 [Deltaproteobacteria bacterium]|nr:hypothetical protein [Deltaproteobacteria bacterium]
MTRRLARLSICMLAACAPKPATPGAPAPSTASAELPGSRAQIRAPILIRAPRPDVTFPDLVPDLAEEPRWPLTGMQHPSLQPSYDVADTLAEPGITWTELCARSVDRRRDPSHHDELIYLGAWCAAERRDPETAVGLLAQVRGSAVPGIARAVPLDVANILVDSQDAEHADQILVHAQLRSAQLYDLIAAAYFEIGRNDDAVQATTSALQLDQRYDRAATCHRLARAALLGREASRVLLATELTRATNGKTPDPQCVELAAGVECAVDPEAGCRTYIVNHHIDDAVWRLAKIDEHWRDPQTWDGWLDVALHIELLTARPESLPMLSVAVEAAVVASECRQLPLQTISNRLDRMVRDGHIPGAAGKLDWARTLYQKPDDCAAFRTKWLADNPQ